MKLYHVINIDFFFFFFCGTHKKRFYLQIECLVKNTITFYTKKKKSRFVITTC